MLARITSSRDEPAKHPTRRHPEDDELGELGRRTLCTKRWALNTRKSPTAMASRGERREVQRQGIAELAGIERRADGLKPEGLMGGIGLQGCLQV